MALFLILWLFLILSASSSIMFQSPGGHGWGGVRCADIDIPNKHSELLILSVLNRNVSLC